MSYALVRTCCESKVLLDNLTEDAVVALIKQCPFASMGTSETLEGFNNDTGEVEYRGGFNLYSQWIFHDWKNRTEIVEGAV